MSLGAVNKKKKRLKVTHLQTNFESELTDNLVSVPKTGLAVALMHCGYYMYLICSQLSISCTYWFPAAAQPCHGIQVQKPAMEDIDPELQLMLIGLLKAGGNHDIGLVKGKYTSR